MLKQHVFNPIIMTSLSILLSCQSVQQSPNKLVPTPTMLQQSPSPSPQLIKTLSDDNAFPVTKPPSPGELKELLDSGLVAKYNEMGFKLFKSIFAKEGLKQNIMISPLSIMLALGMVYNGASGETKAEMARVFAVEDIDIEEFNRLSNLLWRSLVQNQDDVKVKIANSLWLDLNGTLKSSFVEVNRNTYQAQLSQLDFYKQPELAAKAINDWAEKRTNGLIKKLLTKQDVQEALLVLVNTVYFKTNWSKVFDTQNTQAASFELLNGTVIHHPMMPQTNQFSYLKKANGTEVLTKEYETHLTSEEERLINPDRSWEIRYAMTWILPQTGNQITQEVNGLNQEAWQNLKDRLEKSVQYGKILIPKFQASYKGNLTGYLSELGMEKLFDPEKATLNNMTSGRAFVSTVIHETKIDLNEKGTEAAAATAVVIHLPSAPTVTFEFKADHPFIYLIHDAKTGAILFIGSLINPAASETNGN